MITYDSNHFGLLQVAKLNGSAVYRTVIPIHHVHRYDGSSMSYFEGHPIVIGIYIVAFSLILNHRLNYCYQRYWESCGNLFVMTSKWIDSATTLASFHYQSLVYEESRPCSFGDDDCVDENERHRTTNNSTTIEKMKRSLRSSHSSNNRASSSSMSAVTEGGGSERKSDDNRGSNNNKMQLSSSMPSISGGGETMNEIKSSGGRWNKFNKGPSMSTTSSIVSFATDVDKVHGSNRNGNASHDNKNTRKSISLKNLFLQEAAHLFSLMSAVAMSSLRADMEGISSPLVDYVPGQNGQDESHRSTESNTTQQLNNTTISIKRNNAYTNIFLFLFGMSRNARQRTIYNASRPFSVLGGISDQEVEMLRKVRGPAAQHALCTFWLKEFITREHLNGSTGNIAPPIMARVYQYISDGTQQYNQCRKTAFTDFPFPHAQLTSFFILVSIFVFPLLYYQYVTDVWIAMALNFLTTSCFVGIQEVAMELEEPFVRYPNDLPLNNYQAQFNEALISSLYGGFHPDSWGHTYDNGGIFKMGGDWEDGGADGVRDNDNDDGDDDGDINGGRNFSTIDNLSSTRSILKTSSYSMRNTEGSDNFVQ
ncbi:hypothetical protein FRACYDRAFT_193200 [Fragilariopsis cylindrus CCMP1102]|uniref:Uncharacterized protein n=1 Tax=Fragilariopsis cylindrus CCMP1102 TaxID=635003 RepID=A0A1E7F0A5_9STRA|nr:hypothetical protein FRACYDRAFT_193200 [Fragilariopsis cylindrus CCMP1102]|eukprot:OEU11243.1 hypothetical protein FRACYDRAFT_193200 [Fragilariopsis cylindrus CCMP1102]